MSNELIPIQTYDDQPTVDSRDVADRLGIKHKNLIGSIKAYQSAIEKQFGTVVFQTRPASEVSAFKTPKPLGGRPERFALLTEDQCYFLTALSRNTEQVVSFKALLVKSFMAYRRGNKAPALPRPNHNRLSKDRLVDILAVVALVDDKELRTALVQKLMPDLNIPAVQSQPPQLGGKGGGAK